MLSADDQDAARYTAAEAGRRHVRGHGMTIGEAIEHLKVGRRVARAGWNGKGMWLALTPSSVIDGDRARHGAARLLAEVESVGHGEEIRIGAHIDMRAADGTLVIGWLASQTDMLAEDWQVVP